MTAIDNPGLPPENTDKIKAFLQTLISYSGLDLEFRIEARNGQPQTDAPSDVSVTSTGPEHSGETRVVSSAAVVPEITVEFTGPDTPLLTARNAELLHAIEHLAAKVIHLEPDQHDRISFDADDFKALRNRELEQIVEAGAERVRSTSRAYAFPPMNSRERRLLHLALAAIGLPTASSSDGPRRFVVAYPVGHLPAEQPGQSRPSSSSGAQTSTTDRTRAIRNSFRRR